MERRNVSVSGVLPNLNLQSRPEIFDTIQKVEWKEYNTLSELNNSNRVYHFHILASKQDEGRTETGSYQPEPRHQPTPRRPLRNP